MLPSVVTAHDLLFKATVTIATIERFFSNLKSMKNYLRSGIGHEQLMSLSIISVENEVTVT